MQWLAFNRHRHGVLHTCELVQGHVWHHAYLRCLLKAACIKSCSRPILVSQRHFVQAQQCTAASLSRNINARVACTVLPSECRCNTSACSWSAASGVIQASLITSLQAQSGSLWWISLKVSAVATSILYGTCARSLKQAKMHRPS